MDNRQQIERWAGTIFTEAKPSKPQNQEISREIPY